MADREADAFMSPKPASPSDSSDDAPLAERLNSVAKLRQSHKSESRKRKRPASSQKKSASAKKRATGRARPAAAVQETEDPPCPVCSKAFSDKDPCVQCDACDSWFHLKCVNMTVDEAKTAEFKCRTCMSRLRRSTRKSAKKAKPVVPEKRRRCRADGCRRAQRPGSKYCSHDCGIREAEALLVKHIQRPNVLHELPENWAGDTAFDKMDLEAMKKAKDQIEKAEKEQLEREKELEVLLAREAELASPSADAAGDDEEHTRLPADAVECVSCRQTKTARKYVEHVVVCSKRAEAQLPHVVKNPVSDPLQCGEYVTRLGYCTQLRSSCPFHYKAVELDKDGVCGCPNGTPEGCTVKRRACFKHVGWLEIKKRRLRQDIALLGNAIADAKAESAAAKARCLRRLNRAAAG